MDVPLGFEGARVTFSPDGDSVAVAGRRGQVAVFDASTGALLSGVAVGRPDAAVFVAFTPNGHTVSVVTVDGEAYRFDTRVDHWIDFACDTAGRNLTRTEWRESFSDRPYRETCS